MQKTITTSYEVIEHSSLDSDYPTERIENVLPIIERKLIRTQFGLVVYKRFLDDLSEPYASGTKVDEYNEAGGYTTGDYVLFNGEVYISDADNNTALPSDSAKWSLVKKFKSECHNNLWFFMKFWISGYAAALTLKKVTYKPSSKGAVKFTEDQGGVASVNLKELGSLKSEFIEDADDSFEEMFWYMVSETKTYADSKGEEGCDYSYIDAVNEECSASRRNIKRKRRIASPRVGRLRDKNY